MKSMDKLREDIERLREKLTALIQTKEDLLDPDIIQTSEMLDKALDEYNSFIFGSYLQ